MCMQHSKFELLSIFCGILWNYLFAYLVFSENAPNPATRAFFSDFLVLLSFTTVFLFLINLFFHARDKDWSFLTALNLMCVGLPLYTLFLFITTKQWA